MSAVVRLRPSVEDEAAKLSGALHYHAGELMTAARTLVHWPFDGEERQRAQREAREVLALCDELGRLT